MSSSTQRGLESAAALVGDRWALLIAAALLDGPLRFSELQERVAGIAPNILTQRLRSLAADGLVIARPYSDRPPRVGYELSARGRALGPALDALADWGGDGSGGASLHGVCGGALERRWHCPTCDVDVDDADRDIDYV